MSIATNYLRAGVAALISVASLMFGFAGTAHAHGTWSPPVSPRPPAARPQHGPFSVLHQAGPFSVLHQVN